MPHAHQYRFDTFVEGPANAVALAAARAACRPSEEPGGVLVVAGGVGLGKTHLLRAIVNEARRHHVRAAYLTLENVLQRLVGRLRRGESGGLEERLGRFAVLAIDELDGLAGRARTGEEVARLLRDLRQRCRQLVLGAMTDSGHPPTRELARCIPEDARVVELLGPDPTTRLRIVAAKARPAGIVLPLDVARLIAECCPGSVRALEGALVRLGAHALITRRAITLDYAEEVLRPVLRPGRPRPAPARPRRRLRLAERTVPSPAELLAGLAELIEFVREVGGGKIGYPDVRGRDVYVPLVARDGERYVLRLRVTRYLDAPLQCTFVGEHHRRTTAAWPCPDDGGPFRSPDFICTPPTAEFYGYHTERTYRRGDGSFTATVAAVFAALHAPEYAGRFTPARQREHRGW